MVIGRPAMCALVGLENCASRHGAVLSCGWNGAWLAVPPWWVLVLANGHVVLGEGYWRVDGR